VDFESRNRELVVVAIVEVNGRDRLLGGRESVIVRDVLDLDRGLEINDGRKSVRVGVCVQTEGQQVVRTENAVVVVYFEGESRVSQLLLGKSPIFLHGLILVDQGRVLLLGRVINVKKSIYEEADGEEKEREVAHGGFLRGSVVYVVLGSAALYSRHF